jgi:hypothetical protein
LRGGLAAVPDAPLPQIRLDQEEAG